MDFFINERSNLRADLPKSFAIFAGGQNQQKCDRGKLHCLFVCLFVKGLGCYSRTTELYIMSKNRINENKKSFRFQAKYVELLY